MLRIVPVLLIINMITIVQKRENKKQKTKKKSPVYLPAYVTLYNSIKKAGVLTFK